ncbi:MAG: glycosyltransferase [Miltoncostaeaceae bacterium]
MIAAAAPADAVTSQALAWRRLLADHGTGGRIYAEHVHPDLAGEVEHLDRFRAADDPDARVLLRHSIGSRAVEAALTVPRERLALLYHNITPAPLLAAHQPGLARLCQEGRDALPALARAVRGAIADSGYNAAELERAGFPAPRVVPLLLDVADRSGSRTDVSAPRVVSVGRVVPSKRLEEAIRAVALLAHRRPDVNLELIGSWDGFERYRDALERFARAAGVQDAVHLRGRVGDRERDAAYDRAAVYLCTSAHEGFCAPLVEAMARGLPVVAHDAGAVAETLGGAGLVVPAGDAALTAEAIEAVCDDAGLRAGLRARAGARLGRLAPAAVAPRVLAAVREVFG